MIDSLAHSVTTVPAAAPTTSAPDSTAFAGIADSIPAPAADSIRLAADSIELAADSIGLAPADTLFFADFRTAETETPSVWRDTTAAALFGEASVTVQPPRMQAAPPASLTENAAFQSFVLLLAAIYAMLLYRNLGDVRTLLDRISRDTATGQRLSEEPGGSGFSRFLNIATTIGMLFMGVMAVKYGDSLMPSQLETLSHGAVLALSLQATAACYGVVLYQMTVVRLTGAVTLSQPFISQLVLLKRTYFSLGVIVTSPALLLFALCPRGTGNVWFCIIIIELAITAGLYLRETLNLFITKKISILHWFLYLCTVEIFPISLLWLLSVR
ncbi:DUF4271 domain-containing protein [Alistipes senegalensis]|uniref:DUF4271 domain-containing protein n=1 Tax=Alistipes senegalensis TaxID=1288121 RepID=UPI00242F0BC3|nr:DUF4271 domain-containing protein [Alistipes senegalensis]MCI7307037.1 DUF4271 domain-containing protein [Alistipes senegalensis]MDD7038845.1 DUF4271 domain-containing protein [Alistipes senegalensis]MDY2875421.1 DUF4271 domain-containing protein [Alistipes senegalensis]